MKKSKKIIIAVIILVIIGVAGGLSVYLYFNNSNRLNSQEKRFLAENASNVQNINVLNNVNVFGNQGEGLFYDFLNDFAKEYGLEINTVTYNLGENPTTTFLGAGNSLADDEKIFYEDHYVIVGKQYEYVQSIQDLNDKKIGVLSENMSYVSSYLESNQLTLTSYENSDLLLKAMEEGNDIQYIFVPLHLYIDTILNKNYKILYHFSDISYYYKLKNANQDIIGSILNKYFNVWSEKNLKGYYEDHLFDLFTTSLNISSTEIDALQSISYTYGFVENDPYDILAGGNYGGIIAQYLKEFMEFSDIDLKFTKYKFFNQFSKAVANNKLNLYFGYYNFTNNYNSIHSGIDLQFSVAVNKKDSMALHSLKSLENKTVYVQKNTALYNYIVHNTKLNIKTYDTIDDLRKLAKKNKIFIVDTNIFKTYQNSIFDSYSSRYTMKLSNDYVFKTNTNETFNKLFSAFISYKDPLETSYKGIYNYEKTIQTGSITGKLAKYFMYLLIVFIVLFLYVYKVAKRAKNSKKIKKEDKLKYIDQLTSLKNRNYLNENLENWSKNTIYPQTIIVIALNNLQYINDTMGYEQGDIQIKSVANILVKVQLDNSDIIRTDGNEFVVYLVGYHTKQITSYIHKLNKEFKKLPYEYGVAIGYSMIEDDIKTVEDAINEAVEEVKRQKENKKEDMNDKSI